MSDDGREVVRSMLVVVVAASAIQLAVGALTLGDRYLGLALQFAALLFLVAQTWRGRRWARVLLGVWVIPFAIAFLIPLQSPPTLRPFILLMTLVGALPPAAYVAMVRSPSARQFLSRHAVNAENSAVPGAT